MINGIIFEERRNTSKNWGRIFARAFPVDGVLAGCEITHSASSVTVAPGYFIMSGRVLQNDGAETLNVTPMLQNGYMRLKYRIDLSGAPSQEEFTQGSWLMEYAATTTFPALIQQDINGTGMVYEMEVAVLRVSGGSLSVLERTMRGAGPDELVLYQNAQELAIRMPGDYVALDYTPKGGSTIQAIQIANDGTVTVRGAVELLGGLDVRGDISQEQGFRADFGKAVAVRGNQSKKLDIGWDADGEGNLVRFDVFDEAGVKTNAMNIYADGRVTIPQAGIEYSGPLRMQDDVIFEMQNKGIVASHGNVQKQLAHADGGGNVYLGDTDEKYASAKTYVRARNAVVLRPYQSATGYVDMLSATADGVNVAGQVSVAGMLKADGGIEIAGTFNVNQLAVSGLTVKNVLSADSSGVTFTKPITATGVINANGGLNIAGAFSVNSLSVSTMSASGVVTAGSMNVAGGGLVVNGSSVIAGRKLYAQNGLDVTGNITQSIGNVTHLGYEMAINGNSSRRFSIRFLSSGNSGQVAFVIGQGEGIGVMRVDTDGSLTVQQRLSVGSDLDIGGRIKKSGGGIRLQSDGIMVRNYNDTAYVNIAASEFKVTSSIEAKEDVRQYEGALGAVRNANIYEYTRIEDGSKQIGLIIEDEGCPDDVKSVIPNSNDADEGNWGMASDDECVDLYSFISLTTAAVKELAAEKDAQIAQLKQVLVQKGVASNAELEV